MAVSGVNGIGATAYAYMNSSKKTAEESNFASEVQKAEKSQNTTSTTSAWVGIWSFRIRQIIAILHMIAPFPISLKRK